MLVDDLLRLYPRLYHMAADGSWPLIAEMGLLSASALLDLFEVGEPGRSEIESARRPEIVELHHPRYGRAEIRDNKPLNESRLASCLTGGMTPQEWYRLLNSKTFFWPTRHRVDRLLSAAAYRTRPQLVIAVDARELVRQYAGEVELSPINSGATMPFALPRGPQTFKPIADFDFEARRHRGRDAVAEVTVRHSVPNVSEITLSVTRHLPDGSTERLVTR